MSGNYGVAVESKAQGSGMYLILATDVGRLFALCLLFDHADGAKSRLEQIVGDEVVDLELGRLEEVALPRNLGVRSLDAIQRDDGLRNAPPLGEHGALKQKEDFVGVLFGALAVPVQARVSLRPPFILCIRAPT